MEKKKLKLSISGSSKKTINSIEQAKSKSTDGEMAMIQPQTSINTKILKDYKEIFKE